MVVFVENSVMDDGVLVNNPGFASVRDRLMTFRDGKDDLTDKIDFIICLGGDGTLLYASLLFQVRTPSKVISTAFTYLLLLLHFCIYFFSNRFHRLWPSIWALWDF